CGPHPACNGVTPVCQLGQCVSLDGRMTGGGSVLSLAGARVTHGFALHCDPHDGPNSLEINWAGNRFHLDELDAAACTVDPKVSVEPGFNTFTGHGAGACNGTVVSASWTFTDAGEPGTSDVATIHVVAAGGCPGLDVSGPLDHGNQQAHP